jgi:CRP-like cAMP-binding protein
MELDPHQLIEGTVIACYPRRRLEPVIASDPKLSEQIREVAFESILQLQARMLCLGRTTALEKVGSFLLEMAERLPQGSMRDVALPMSRYDIADYLSLSVETVSRAVTELRRRGAISLAGAHHVIIVDARALSRGLPRDAGAALRAAPRSDARARACESPRARRLA